MSTSQFCLETQIVNEGKIWCLFTVIFLEKVDFHNTNTLSYSQLYGIQITIFCSICSWQNYETQPNAVFKTTIIFARVYFALLPPPWNSLVNQWNAQKWCEIKLGWTRKVQSTVFEGSPKIQKFNIFEMHTK